MKETEKKVLGRGIASLIPDIGALEKSSIFKEDDAHLLCDINDIVPADRQPREVFDEASIAELAASITTHGILQPLVVTRKDGVFRIVIGERRFHAAKKAGLRKVPVIVKKMSELERWEVALVENIQRQNLNPIEEARALKYLHEEFNLTHEEIGKRIGKDRASITNALRLLSLPTPIQKLLSEETITEGHAKVLLGIDKEEDKDRVAKLVVTRGLSVRALENLVKTIPSKKKHAKKEVAKPVSFDSITVQQFIDDVTRLLGTKVYFQGNLQANSSGGKIIIHYHSEEDLGRIYEILMASKKGK
jgi:ParB family chromosome partitioning protein